MRTPTPPLTTLTSLRAEPTIRWTISLIALLIALLGWTRSANADDCAEAVEIAKRANADAIVAIDLAKQAREERDVVVKQRDDYRSQRDTARSAFDRLTGELDAARRDRALADARLVELVLARKKANQRWWFAGAGVVAGALATAAVVIVSR